MLVSILRVLYMSAILVVLSQEAWAIDYIYSKDKGLQLAWTADDKVGITTGNVTHGFMDQLTFWISGKATANSGEKDLYAPGYQLKAATTYYSYFPYRWQDEFDARNIVCSYDKQTQTGNGSTVALSKYDFQMAAATTTADACSFAYEHIGGVLRISFPAPKAMTVRQLTVESQHVPFPMKAVMNIIDKEVKVSDYSLTLTLATENITVAEGEEVVLYLACPVNYYSYDTLSVTVTDSNADNHEIARFIGPDVRAGYLYEITLPANQEAKAKQGTKGEANQEAKANQEPMANKEAPLSPMPPAVGITNPRAATKDIETDKTFKLTIINENEEENEDEDNNGTVNGSENKGEEEGEGEEKEKEEDNDNDNDDEEEEEDGPATRLSATSSSATIKSSTSDYYTLQGMKVKQPKKGAVYIYKGKKITK